MHDRACHVLAFTKLPDRRNDLVDRRHGPDIRARLPFVRAIWRSRDRMFMREERPMHEPRQKWARQEWPRRMWRWGGAVVATALLAVLIPAAATAQTPTATPTATPAATATAAATPAPAKTGNAGLAGATADDAGLVLGGALLLAGGALVAGGRLLTRRAPRA